MYKFIESVNNEYTVLHTLYSAQQCVNNSVEALSNISIRYLVQQVVNDYAYCLET